MNYDCPSSVKYLPVRMNAAMRALMMTETATTLQSYSGPRDARNEIPEAERKTTPT